MFLTLLINIFIVQGYKSLIFKQMYLFAVLGFFAAFVAFMKFGSNDFGISSGKSQSKDQKTS